jgi:hypothetical protein
MSNELINVVDGKMIAENHQELWRVAEMAVKSGMLPKAYTQPAQVVTAIQYAKELGIQAPMNALRQIAIINGTPSLFGELPLAIVKASGKLDSYDEYCVDKNYTRISLENKNLGEEIFASVAKITRKGESEKTFAYTRNEAKKTGSLDKQVWKLYEETMFLRKARSKALKTVFPDVLSGASICEDQFDTIPTNNAPLTLQYATEEIKTKTVNDIVADFTPTAEIKKVDDEQERIEKIKQDVEKSAEQERAEFFSNLKNDLD